jgi:hypothetical protein
MAQRFIARIGSDQHEARLPQFHRLERLPSYDLAAARATHEALHASIRVNNRAVAQVRTDRRASRDDGCRGEGRAAGFQGGEFF